ncbi:hypothetical protein L195_g036034 [Trifolium pratense]|uniref:Uncharacterized protein n=1 Tax=Trifolium pratense TaxID=57577 RepID=A0A2K3LND4_TRIPR|nr:hypothetical protein L195_g036034 [Trifolium pratense]
MEFMVTSNNIWKQALDSSFTVENCACQLLEGWNLALRPCSVSGLMLADSAEHVTASDLMRGEPTTASGLIQDVALRNATADGPGAEPNL